MPKLTDREIIEPFDLTKQTSYGLFCSVFMNMFILRINNLYPTKKNTPLRTVQLSGILQGIGQFSLYQCKGMSGTAASHVFCNQASKFC